MWIDTHVHLDAAEFAADRPAVMARARAADVHGLVIPAIGRHNFTTVRALAHSLPGAAYTLGIHPLCVMAAADEDLEHLQEAVAAAQGDPRFVGIGEIGLDGFVPGLDMARQIRFFRGQLKIARNHALPVLLHVRKAQDLVLRHLREIAPPTGIAHAFNGSFQQAGQFIGLGFALGFGGNLTFERARQIRRLAVELPIDAIVLETDAPDIAPAWRYKQRNEPAEVARIAQELAALRGMPLTELAAVTGANAKRVLRGWHGETIRMR
ncbi:MAG: TatD family hydrolase [Burkholderiaceae bacterium]|jgi:TatD DNase family protein